MRHLALPSDPKFARHQKTGTQTNKLSAVVLAASGNSRLELEISLRPSGSSSRPIALLAARAVPRLVSLGKQQVMGLLASSVRFYLHVGPGARSRRLASGRALGPAAAAAPRSRCSVHGPCLSSEFVSGLASGPSRLLSLEELWEFIESKVRLG